MILTGLFFVKASAVLITLLVISYLFFKRRKSNSKTDAQFKHNVGLLREEKLLIHTDKKLQKKRLQLLKKTKISENVNQIQLMSKSKKLRMPAGEILLAAKIQMNSK